MSWGLLMADAPEPVTVLCQECGHLIEVRDVAALILSLHIANDCDLSSLVAHRDV